MKFASLVEQFVASDVRRNVTWYDKLSEEMRREVDAIKKKYKAGQYGKTSKRSLARAIIAAAKDHGMQICGEHGVREWLAKD